MASPRSQTPKALGSGAALMVAKTLKPIRVIRVILAAKLFITEFILY
jgi:hypothetical protein